MPVPLRRVKRTSAGNGVISVNDPKETSVTRCVMRGQFTGASLVPCVLRPPTVEELPTLSALCLRSKAVWGYDEDFIESCRTELTIEPCDLRSSSIAVAEENGRIAGVVQIKVIGSEADLLKLFVEPTMLRGGVGMKLFTGLPPKQQQWVLTAW